MAFVSVLLLTVTGLMAAQEWFSARFPQLQGMLEGLHPARALIGAAALALGIVWFLLTMRALFFVSFAPVSVLLSLAGSGLLAKLGFMFAVPLLNEQLFKNNESMRGKIVSCQGMCEKHREKMGIAAVGISIVLLIVFIAGIGI